MQQVCVITASLAMAGLLSQFEYNCKTLGLNSPKLQVWEWKQRIGPGPFSDADFMISTGYDCSFWAVGSLFASVRELRWILSQCVGGLAGALLTDLTDFRIIESIFELNRAQSQGGAVYQSNCTGLCQQNPLLTSFTCRCLIRQYFGGDIAVCLYTHICHLPQMTCQ